MEGSEWERGLEGGKGIKKFRMNYECSYLYNKGVGYLGFLAVFKHMFNSP